MTELIKQGLQVSALGMGLTFAALGLLIVTMLLLERLFRVPEPQETEDEVIVTAVPPTEENEVAVAIAVALSHLQAKANTSSNLGANLETGRGAWWQLSHTRHRSRTPVRKKIESQN